MARTIIDRTALPKSWANPLRFRAVFGEHELEIEIEQSAAIEYQIIGRGGLMAMLIADDSRETFLQQLEAAIDQINPGRISSGILRIGWSDLHPELAKP